MRETASIVPPEFWLARQTLAGRDIGEVPFVATAALAGRERFKPVVKFAGLSLAAGALAVTLACSPDAKAGTQPSQSPPETPAVTTIIQAPTPEPPKPTATSTVVVPTETPTPPKPEPTAIPAATPDSQATPAAQKPPTPDVVKEVTPCFILKPEFCKDAILIELPSLDIPGQFTTFVALNPPAGVELFADTSGQIIKEITPKFFNGSLASILDLSNPRGSSVVIGALKMSPKTENKKAGEPFASIDGSEVNNFGYRLLIYKPKLNEKGQEISDDEYLKAKFPDAYKLPPKRYNTMPAPDNKTSAMGSPIYR